jgi:branched-subunit amino acid ABC-type transport system permease component
MSTFLQAVISGLVMGSVYAIMTVGLTLVYGSLRTLNMAQGTFGMIGGYIAWLVATDAGLHPILGLLAAVVVGGLLGIVTYYMSVQPLLGRKDIDFEMTVYISTLVVAIMMASGATIIWGARDKAIAPVFGGQFTLTGSVTVTWHSIVIAVVAFGSLAILSWFLNHTRHGLSVMAVAQEREAARLAGVRVNGVYLVVMGIAGMLGALAGVLLAPLYFVSPVAGDLPLLKGLIVAILAGLGSIRGTIWAALLVGLFEAMASTYVSTMWSLPLLFAVIAGVMIVRPYGLFGKPEEERL